MTTSSDKPYLSTLLPRERPPAFVLGYLASDFIASLHQRLMTLFLEKESKKEISKAEIARRLTKDPAVVNRWLSGPGNWELRTVSDLAAAMGYKPDVRFVPIREEKRETEDDSMPIASLRPAFDAQNDSFNPDTAFNRPTPEKKAGLG